MSTETIGFSNQNRISLEIEHNLAFLEAGKGNAIEALALHGGTFGGAFAKIERDAGRATRADQLRFFQIAMGSVRECQAIYQLERNSFSREASQLLDLLAASCFLLIRNAR